MFNFAHRILASSASVQEINTVAQGLMLECGVQFGTLQPGKRKCLAADTSISPWGKKRLGSYLQKKGFKKSGNRWIRDDLEVINNDDHLVIQERDSKEK